MRSIVYYGVRSILQSVREFLRHYAGGLWRCIGEHDIMFMAAALSFSVLVCIVPFILICFSVGGLVLEKSAFTGQIDSFIDVIVPYPETARFVKEFVSTQVTEFRLYKNLAGVIGFVGLFIASSALFSNIRTIFNKIYPITKNRSLLVTTLHDFGMILLVMLLFLLAAALFPAVQLVIHFAQSSDFLAGFKSGELRNLVIEGAAFVLLFFSLFLVHLLVPATRPSKGSAFVAAVSTAVLWLIAQRLFGLYITEVATLRRIYGAYVLGIVVFFWIHYSSVVFILGTEIGQLYRERKEKG